MAIELTERITLVLSLIGTAFNFLTFLTSKAHRRPVNRPTIYASLWNTAMSIATLISLAGIRADKDSALCQFQGFLIQMSAASARNFASRNCNNHGQVFAL